MHYEEFTLGRREQNYENKIPKQEFKAFLKVFSNYVEVLNYGSNVIN